MSRYWWTYASNGCECFGLYVETYEAAVHFDLDQADSSLIRSVCGALPTSIEACEAALAEGAFQQFAGAENLPLLLPGAEEIAEIPRGLQGTGVGGADDTCAVVVYQQPSAPNPARS